MIQNPGRFIIVMLCLIVMLSIAKSFYYTEKFGGTDLRCRIVGSRLLLTDHSPYFYKWTKGDDVRYLDPNDNPHRRVNGNVVTPALLLLNKPLSLLSYYWVRISWTFIQYCFFVLTLLLVWKSHSPNQDLMRPVMILLFGFLMSDIWFDNVERGQTYILYAFIFSFCHNIYHRKWKHGHLLAGAVAGISIWIRPLFVFINIPFLLVKDFRWLMGSVIGFFAGLLFFFIPFRKTWTDYRDAMTHYEMESEGKESFLTTNDTFFNPNNVEGVSNLTLFRTENHSGGLSNVQGFMKKMGVILDSKSLILAFGLVLIFLSWVFLNQSNNKFQKNTDLFLFAFFLYMLSELFIIGYRGSYNMIEWLFAFCIMLISGNRNIVVSFLLALAVGFMNGWPFLFPHQNQIGETIAFYVLIDFIFIHKISEHKAIHV